MTHQKMMSNLLYKGCEQGCHRKGVQGFELPVYQGFPYKPNKISGREELSYSERMENGGENKECGKWGKSKKTSLALAPFSTRPECENSSSVQYFVRLIRECLLRRQGFERR